MRKPVATGVFVFLSLLTAVAAQEVTPPIAQPPDEIRLNEKVVGKRVPPQPGDICRVCNQPVDEKDAVYRVRGHRIAIHQHEVATDLRAQLAALVTELEPRAALFGTQNGTLSNAWLYFGLYVLVGLAFGALCAHRALIAGYGPLGWFGLGMLFNVFAFGVLLTRPRREIKAPAGIPAGLGKIAATYQPVVCQCGAENHPSARNCSTCGAALEPRTTSEVERVGLKHG